MRRGWSSHPIERWWIDGYASDLERRTGVQKEAQAFLEYPFVVFDTETTGLEAVREEIVQIGVVNHRGEVLMDTLIKPRYPIPEEATDIHGITNENVAQAPSFRDVYDELYRVLDNQRWAGYNLSFDSDFILMECKRGGLWKPSPAMTCNDDNWSDYQLDVMSLYAEWWGDWHEYYESYTWQKLSVANERHHLYDGQAHNAVADALTTLNLLKMMGANKNG